MSDTSARQFNAAVMPHLDLVYRIALKMTGNVSEAEDLVQETFLRAYRSFGQFELREYGAKPWLLKILHNVFITQRSHEKRAPSLMDDLSLDDFAAELESNSFETLPAGQMDWESFDDELKAAVEALAPDYRSVLLLWGLGDLSYKEISQILGCALGTVMSRLFRARQQLALMLADYAAQRGLSRDRRDRSPIEDAE
ncbi:MAG TPA: sigma-70 family RNA polymerase sigma factor [Phycisphaerae bacterium]|nr:sigma-70 family RNA polymerase sigma factor [Phycisphaerae bacterium]